MIDSILQTKLYMPRKRPGHVQRPRLLERFAPNGPCKLILVSAPAGYGKTTLVTSWLQQLQGVEACWLSLDEDDSDAVQFFRYLAAAVQPLPDVGASLRQLLQTNQPIPAKTLGKAFVKDVTTVSRPFFLVLDDYHALDGVDVDLALGAVLDLMPPQMTLVLTSRSDPGFPISRLRARGELVEVRADDLRFTEAEASQFLQETMLLDLAPEQIAALENRTEGWIAGLQMAALAIRGTRSTQKREADAVEAFVHSFSGSHRFVLDYLVEETLQQQPDTVRSFLLATSVLDRMCGPLCEAVVGRLGIDAQMTEASSGQAMLEELERANLFVIPLDDRRRWYRYHHLFADVLQSHLMEEQPDRLAILHRRASQWYEQNDLRAEAVRHALLAQDFERAAGLAERAWREMDRSYQSGMWLGWVQALPDELVGNRPVLSAQYAWALLDGGELEAAEVRLGAAERWLNQREEAEAPPEMVVVDENEARSLPITVANARAYLAQALGDFSSAAEIARQALELPLEKSDFEHGLAALLLGFAYWAGGELEAARGTVSETVSKMWMAGNVPFAISFTSYLADIMVAQGCLREAVRTYEQALRLATEQGGANAPETAVLHLGLSELYHEQGDAEAAKGHLLRSEEPGEQPAFPPWHRRWAHAHTRNKESQGDLDGALEVLAEAEGLFYRHPIPDVRPLTALKARLWIRQGKLTEAVTWAREQGLSTADDLSYLREFEHITLARLLIARYRRDGDAAILYEALDLLERLLRAAEAGGRSGSVIEILALQALAHEAEGNVPAARKPLQRALALAAPEGYVRIFVDEGAPMKSLLQESGKQGANREYVGRLLDVFGEGKGEGETAVAELLPEPLSERELEVLALIAAGLKNKEIAEELVISVNTVLYHNKNIYGKLSVNKRALAIARARELGLV